MPITSGSVYNALQGKANSSNVYTKSEVNALLAGLNGDFYSE